MKLQDALNLLGLSGTVTFDEAKAAYRRACMKYHPDRNPAGAEMMKAVTEAWRILEAWDFAGKPVEVKESANANYGDAIMAALNAIIDLPGITIEVCGAWVWISGNSYPHRAVFKEAGFKWASKKKQWYFRPPEWQSANRYGEWTIEDIREKFGSETVQGNQERASRPPELAGYSAA